MNFIEKLLKASEKNKSLLCVGLDVDPERMPEKVGIFEFNKAIIDATSDLVCAYKPNITPVICDAKRGDIGNTARAYARTLFDNFNFDATTVSPYLGFDSLEPFLSHADKGVLILCRTSNAGAVDFQSLLIEGEKRPLFEIVATKAAEWNTRGNVGLVIGATYPEELRLIRQNHPDMPILIPGVGAQGGDLATAVRYGVDARGQKAIINSSRGIIYASKGKDFAQAARRAATELRDQMNRHLGQ
jgi:orotidine-5'-phosphate decarboxylase